MGVRMVAGELLLGFAAAGVDLPPLPAASPTTHCTALLWVENPLMPIHRILYPQCSCCSLSDVTSAPTLIPIVHCTLVNDCIDLRNRAM